MGKRTEALRVYCSKEEALAIAELAARTGLSVSTLMRRVTLGHPVPSREDAQALRDLLKVNADLARLGNLLKMALTEENKEQVNTVTAEIHEAQKLLKQHITSVQRQEHD